jgi:predicted  nucleic acid-binding Zn-ribbon protein
LDASVIETLASLQEIDRRIKDREIELADLERETGGQRALFEAKEAEAATARGELAQVATRRRELEAKLQDEEARMKERRMLLGRLRNDKEAAALQREIEIAKETNSRVEEELLTLIEQSETLEGNLKVLDDELRAIGENVARLGEASGGRTQALRSEIAAGRGEREALAARLGAPLRRRYEQVFQRRDGIAVIVVTDGHCGGCKVTLPPQLWNRIRSGTEFDSCPSCQRLLVWQAGRADPAAAAAPGES